MSTTESGRKLGRMWNQGAPGVHPFRVGSSSLVLTSLHVTDGMTEAHEGNHVTDSHAESGALGPFPGHGGGSEHSSTVGRLPDYIKSLFL